ncbi:flavin-nucleotide-binding protein [Arthrobacter livingstonensis]|uniref:Flavin-nucleotide-binding protein n=1 Tax=Arthrobacter livingstonensis TaxID=670078 RepID=A0A2V5LFT9_9MICC|nr:pyridoxamine 5'-phosphate oxidase family protein [Arthrobacter livingstonensis]PYI65240.1 flavin-nucleotide-binding protein [Arthrobacter livingstonensis]
MRDNNVVPQAEILDTQQCWKLLRETTIGRLAVTADGRPDVFPVNYKVDQETMIFRTGDGTKLSAMEADANVALEADAVSAEFGFAWSVVVKGRAVVVASTDTTLDTVGRALFPWQGVNKEHLIRIVPETVTGRRFTLKAPMSWRTPLNDAIRAGLE